jgi:hypothetical protein
MSDQWELELKRRAAAADIARQKAEAQLEHARDLLRQKDETITQLTRGRSIEKVKR